MLKPQKVQSIEALRELVPLIVKRANDDPGFGLRAATNPILALEELGIEMTPEVRHEVERLARFSPKDQERSALLAAQVHKLAGRHVDLHDEAAVSAYLKPSAGAKQKDALPDAAIVAIREYRQLLDSSKKLASAESYRKLTALKENNLPIKRIRFTLQRSGPNGPPSPKAGPKRAN